MNIIVKKYKSAIILFCLSLFIFYSFIPQQPVYALDGRTYVTIAEAAAITAETAAATGATVAITPIVVGTLVAGALLYGGYKVVSTYGNEIQSYIKSKTDKLSFKETNDYLYTKDGKVGLTPSGYAWANDIGSTLKKDSSFSTNDNTSNIVGNGSPYQFGKFYMRPYSVFSVDKKNYIFVKVSAYDTINICIKGRSDKVSYVKTLTPTKDTYYRVRSYSMSGTAEIHSSEDNKDYYRVTFINGSDGKFYDKTYFTSDSTVYIGYYTESGTVYAPDGVVTSVPPTPMEVGQTVALPSTSTQIEGMTVYDTSLDFGSITSDNFTLDVAPSPSPSPNPNPNENTDIDSDGSIIGKIGEWVGNLVLRIPILGTILQTLLDTLAFLKDFIGKLISSLRDLLISLFIPSSDIFRNKFKSIQEGLNNAFPVNFDILNNLKNANSSEPNLVYPFTIMGINVKLDLNFIKIIVNVSRTISSGLVAIFLTWYHYRHIVHIIRGTSPITGDGHIGQTNSPISEPSANISHNGFSSGNFSNKGGK